MSVAGMAALVRPAYVFDDHAGLHATLEKTPHDLPVAAPQTLNDLGVHDRPCPGRLQHNGLEVRVDVVRPGHERRVAVRSGSRKCPYEKVHRYLHRDCRRRPLGLAQSKVPTR